MLDDGKVLEYDAPAALLEKPHGAFKGMVDAANAH